MPWDIGKLTLFQWQIYTEKIEKIYRLFHPEPKEKSSKKNTGSPSVQNKEDHEELKRLARRKGIKVPKGL